MPIQPPLVCTVDYNLLRNQQADLAWLLLGLLARPITIDELNTTLHDFRRVLEQASASLPPDSVK